MICPNINTQEWKALEAKVGKEEAYRIWISNKYEIPDAVSIAPTIKGNDNFPVILSAIRQSKQSIVSIDSLKLSDEHRRMLSDLIGSRSITRQQLIDEVQGYVSHVTKDSLDGAMEKVGDQWVVRYNNGAVRYFDSQQEASSSLTANTNYTVSIADKPLGKFFWEGDTVSNVEGGLPVVLAAAYRVYQKLKNAFLSADGKRSQLPKPAFFEEVMTDAQVIEELKRLLSESGIEMSSIEHWQEMTGKKATDGANALADLASKMIAVREGKLSAEVLAEEIAHFVIGAQQGSELEAMLDLVERTETWKQASQQYLDAYAGNERMAKMEVLGKILSDRIIKNVRVEKASGPIVRLIAMLRRAWNRFLSNFSPSQRLKLYVDSLAKNTIAKGIPQEMIDKNVFYSIDTLNYKDNFDSIIESIEQRIEALRRRNRSMTVGDNIDKLKYELGELKEYRNNMNYAAGYVRFIEYMIDDINQIMTFMNRVRLGLDTLSPEQLMNMGDFVSYYEPYMDAILQFLNYGDVSAFTDDQVNWLAKTVEDQLVPNFRMIRHFRDIKREEQFNKLVRSWWAKELGLDKSHPDFVQQVSDATGGYDLKDAARRLQVEGNQVNWWIGSIRDASDHLLRLIYAKVLRIDQRVHMRTVDFGKDLANKAAELGIKDQDRFLERENGKRTGFYLEKTRRRAWQSSRKKFYKDTWRKYKVPEDPEARRVHMDQWKEQHEMFPQSVEARQYEAYKAEIALWHKQNTIQKEQAEIDRIINERKRLLTPQQYNLWESRNILRFPNGNGGLYTVFAGELVEPSDGRTIRYKGNQIRTKDWRNSEYDKLTDNEKEFLKYIVEKKTEIDAMLPALYDNHQAPQLTDTMIQIFRKKRDKNTAKKIRDNMVDEITVRQAEDDAIFGEKTLLRPDGSRAKYVPIYYTKLLGDRDMEFEDRLNETDKISTDLINGLVAYHEMASRWSEMSKIAPELELIAEQAGKREFQRKNGERIAGSQTAIQKQLRTFLDMQVYGMKVVGGEKWQFTLPENSILEFFGLSGKTISGSKFFKQLGNYVRANNLGLNFFTTASNFVQANVFNKIEDLVTQYTSVKSSKWAEKKFWENIYHVIGESGSVLKSNKMYLFMEKMGIQGSPEEMFRNTDMNRLSRRALETGLYFSYEMIEFWRSSRIMMAIMHNYRQYEGKWYNEKQFKKEYPNGKFDELPNIYDLSRVTMDGKIELPISEEDFLKLASRVKFVAQAIDGRLDKLDYAAAHQHFIAQLMTIHRGWLISGLYRRLKKKGLNVSTGDMEEGYWNTTFSFLGKTFMHENRMQFVRNGLEEWNNLNDYEKENIKRMIYEMLFASMATAVAIIFNGLADDDDDYGKDVMAYMSNRVLMELGAFVPPIIVSELTNTLANPLVPMRQIELMFDFNDMFFGSEEIESGQWKRFTKRQRAFYRLIPGVKGLALIRDPKSANQFLKNKPLRSVPYSWYGN